MARALEVSHLDCRSAVERGAWLVLNARFQEMLALREAALDFSDSEGVHNMRVASRRLRSALRDFEFLLRKKRFKSLNRVLKNVAAALGGVRDEDVALIALDVIAKKASAQVATGIKRIAEERRARRDAARTQLVEAISLTRITKLEAVFAAALAPLAATTENSNKKQHNDLTQTAATDFKQTGYAVISKCLEDVCKLSRSLYFPLQPEPLHELRIAAKRLRYALELFAVCWGNDVVSPFAKEIAALQSSLGELHDADEWIVELGSQLEISAPPMIFAAKSVAASKSPEAAEQQQYHATHAAEDHHINRQAAIWLLQHFLKERTKHYQAALTRWHEWEANNFAERLATQLHAQPELKLIAHETKTA